VNSTAYSTLVVEDNDNDAFFLERAFRKIQLPNPLTRVKDGMDAIAYLKGTGIYTDREKFPFPEVLYVDLKMPRMSGLELLTWIQNHPQHRVIPTIVMSTSNQQSDVHRAYQLGANTYFVKPASLAELTQLVATIHTYWKEVEKPVRGVQVAREMAMRLANGA
jgi:CheY-like chemotaxis protein